jgi:D-glycerate 3-kinase
LGKQSRIELGLRVHPLFRVRGVPGTHETEKARAVFRSLRAARPETQTALPRFDKLTDDTQPVAQWPVFVGKPDLILFDTWLWDVVPPEDEELLAPINRREREEDVDASFRLAAGRALRQHYRPLFDEADEWISLESPNWDATIRFREEQESARLSSLGKAGESLMKRASMRAFLELFERWIQLPHVTAPQYRILLDEHHAALLLA